MYLSLNGTTANVVHYDLELHFQVHKFFNVNILKTVRDNKKIVKYDILQVDICHLMGPL